MYLMIFWTFWFLKVNKNRPSLYFHITSESERIINEHMRSHNMEVQQRSVEYHILFNKHNNLRPGVLEPMPQFERPPKDEEYGTEEDEIVNSNENTQVPAVQAAAPPPAEQVCLLKKIYYTLLKFY